MTTGPFVGFCPRCRNKVRAPYVSEGRHIAHVAVRLRKRHIGEAVCNGEIVPGTFNEASEMQAEAGISPGGSGAKPWLTPHIDYSEHRVIIDNPSDCNCGYPFAAHGDGPDKPGCDCYSPSGIWRKWDACS